MRNCGTLRVLSCLGAAVLPDHSPLALALCLPASWMGSPDGERVLDTLRQGLWQTELQRADAAWAGGVIHQVLVHTAGTSTASGTTMPLSVASRAALVAALLQGGARAPAAPGLLGPAYRLDARTTAWLAHAERAANPQQVGAHMDLVAEWVPLAWSSSLKSAQEWLTKKGWTWLTEIGGWPLWAHAAVSSMVPGLDHERQGLMASLPQAPWGGTGYMTPKESRDAAHQHVRTLLREAVKAGQEKESPLTQLFRKPKRSNLRKTPDAHEAALKRLWAYEPSSGVGQEWVARLKEPWINAAMGTPVSPGWEEVLATWSKRWPTPEAAVGLVEWVAEPNSVPYGPLPVDVLRQPAVAPQWLQQLLVAIAVVGHANPTVHTWAIDGARQVTRAHPGLPALKVAIPAARSTYPLRPNRLDFDVLKALELECDLPEAAPSVPKPRF